MELNRQQLKQLLNITLKQIDEYRKSGQLKGRKLNGEWVVLDTVAWIFEAEVLDKDVKKLNEFF